MTIRRVIVDDEMYVNAADFARVTKTVALQKRSEGKHEIAMGMTAVAETLEEIGKK